MTRLKSLSIGAAACALSAIAMLPPAQAGTADTIWGTPATHVASVYQNPDGSYPSYNDFNRDLNGIPCGIRCTQRSESRWNEFSDPKAYYGAFPR